MGGRHFTYPMLRQREGVPGESCQPASQPTYLSVLLAYRQETHFGIEHNLLTQKLLFFRQSSTAPK